MTIKPIEINNLSELELSSIFLSKKWLEIYSKEELMILGIFNLNDEIIGCFCLGKTKRMKLLSHYSSPPFMPHCSLFFVNNATNTARKHSAIKKIMKSIASYLDNLNLSIITLPFPPSVRDMQYFSWTNFKVIPSYTYQLNLQETEENLLQNMDPKVRNLIKKANKDGLVVEQNFDYKVVKDIVMKTMQRNNVSINNSVLEKILFQFANENNSYSFVTKKNGEVLAMTFCIYDANFCYYLLGGYNTENSHSGAGPLVVFNSIKYAKELGVKIFDFEGSMLPKVESYFRSFGGELTPYFTANKSSFLLESLLKFNKRQQF